MSTELQGITSASSGVSLQKAWIGEVKFGFSTWVMGEQIQVGRLREAIEKGILLTTDALGNTHRAEGGNTDEQHPTSRTDPGINLQTDGKMTIGDPELAQGFETPFGISP